MMSSRARAVLPLHIPSAGARENAVTPPNRCVRRSATAWKQLLGKGRPSLSRTGSRIWTRYKAKHRVVIRLTWRDGWHRQDGALRSPFPPDRCRHGTIGAKVLIQTFSHADLAAAAWFVIAWVGYGLVLERTPLSRHSLNSRMDVYRRIWMRHMVEREVRI